jgi:hypothetical protein
MRGIKTKKPKSKNKKNNMKRFTSKLGRLTEVKESSYSLKKIGGSKTKKRNHNKSKNKQKFVKLNCSPENQDKALNSFTCYSNEDLHKLRDIWNARHPDTLIQTNDPKEIWKTIKTHYKNVCNKESCWVKQMVKNSSLEKELMDSFAPESPDDWKKNPNEWLSSVDIVQVMSQYEKKYKCFDFMGPSPIDYDTHKLHGECVWEELCHFNLEDQIKNGKTKIGIIFNTDPHYKGGSHWISLFINIKKGTIFFFDSTGDKIPKQIMKFVNNVIEQGHTLNPRIDFKFDENHPVEHQYGNTECGIYSLFFIVHMLEDKITAHYLKTHILKDEYMENFRKIYFNSDL